MRLRPAWPRTSSFSGEAVSSPHRYGDLAARLLELTADLVPRIAEVDDFPPNVVIDALRRNRITQVEEWLAVEDIWTDTGLVSTTAVGTPHFHSTRDTARLPRIRFHDLRHTAASLLLTQGVEPRVIMKTLGHSQITLTLNTYAHVLPAMQRVAAERMDELLGVQAAQ